MSRMLVTGGAGFIGSHLTDALLAAGHEVIVLDNLATGKRENLNPKAIFYEADLRDEEGLAELFDRESIDAVFHLAAQASVAVSTIFPARDAEINIIGLLNLLVAASAHGVKRFLFSSTGGAIYQSDAVLPFTEDTPALPLSVYGLSKWAGERYLEYYVRVESMELTILRLANVFGPRQDSQGEAGVVSIFTDKMLADGDPVIDGTGEQTRDFIYVADVVSAFIAAYEQALVGTYNIGTGKETSVNQVYAWLQAATGFSKPERHGAVRPNDMLRSVLSSDKMQATGQWRHEVALKEGIDRTVAWFRQSALTPPNEADS